MKTGAAEATANYSGYFIDSDDCDGSDDSDDSDGSDDDQDWNSGCLYSFIPALYWPIT